MKMAQIWKWVRHNQGVTVSMLVVCSIMIWTFGCESKVGSLVNPNKKVNRAELNLEISSEMQRLKMELDNMIGMGEIKQADLDRQDEIKKKLMDFAAITAEGSTVNPAGVVGLLFSVFGIGAVIDNRLKDKVIKNRPLPKNES